MKTSLLVVEEVIGDVRIGLYREAISPLPSPLDEKDRHLTKIFTIPRLPLDDHDFDGLFDVAAVVHHGRWMLDNPAKFMDFGALKIRCFTPEQCEEIGRHILRCAEQAEALLAEPDFPAPDPFTDA